MVVHGTAVGVILYLLLAIPHIWNVEVQQGEAVVICAQMPSVAATAPEVVQKVVSIEPVPIEPPPPIAVDHTPVTDTLIAVPASIPVVRNGEYEATEVPPQQQPPESPASVVQETKTPPREVAKTETKPTTEAKKTPDRQIAQVVVDSPNKVNLVAAAPTVVGAIDEMPRSLPNNRIPLYPLEALRAGYEGKVVLRVKIDATGRADKIAVEKSSGLTSFDNSAIEAVRDWKFSPAKRGGTAVAHEVLVPVRFRINRG